MNQTLIRNLLLAAACWFAAQAASAAETGFYVGGFYSTNEKDESIDIYNGFTLSAQQQLGYSPLQASAPGFDTKANGYGFIGGYRLFQNFAIEGGYMQLGSVKYRYRANGLYPPDANNPNGFPSSMTLNVDNEIGGIAVSALGILPVSYRWEVYGRAGVMFATHDFKFYIADAFGPIKDGFSESATDFLAGAGVSFMLAEVYTLRGEFIRVFDAGNKDNGEGDVDVISLGITVKF